MNPYTQYYVNQAGSGLPGFTGVRYQRGHGFFGRIFSTAILPVLKYLGKTALSTGANVASDMLEGQNFKEALKSRAQESGKEVLKDAIARTREYTQRGSGYKRKLAFDDGILPKRRRRRRRRRAASTKRTRSTSKPRKVTRRRKTTRVNKTKRRKATSLPNYLR